MIHFTIIAFLFVLMFAATIPGYLITKQTQEDHLIDHSHPYIRFPQETTISPPYSRICTRTLKRADICLQRFTNALLRSSFGHFVNARVLNETMRNFIGVNALN